MQNVNDDLDEELLNEENFRFTLKPINPRYKIFWDLYKKQEECFWKAEAVDFSRDYQDFLTLTPEEQYFVKMVLAFFAASDGIVNFNLRKRFLNEIMVTEAQTAYGFQLMMENVHSELYSDMLINIIKDPVERDFLFNAIKNIPIIKKMADWTFKWIDSPDSIAHRIIAFAIVEGVFFSSAFAAIFWLKKMRSQGKLFMEGLVKSNRYISRDEGMHCNFACALYTFIKHRVPSDKVYEMFDESVEISKEFAIDAIRCDMIGMNNDLMVEYIKYVADRLLVSLGYEKRYNATNPFDFMETISLLSKDNFFENRPDSYQQAHNEENNAGWKFEIQEDF